MISWNGMVDSWYHNQQTIQIWEIFTMIKTSCVWHNKIELQTQRLNQLQYSY